MVYKCDGCVLLKAEPTCFYRRVDGCPCINCLVKVMCKKHCNDLRIHGQKVESGISIKR